MGELSDWAQEKFEEHSERADYTVAVIELKLVIVGQRSQKERLGSKNTKQTKTKPQNNHYTKQPKRP